MPSRTAARPGTVWAVHCIDTEGPLEETLDATFERINRVFGTALEPSLATLAQLQRGGLPLGGAESEIARFVSPSRLAYLSTWREIEEMIVRVTDPRVRQLNHDSAGRPYVFTWFVLDVVGYRDNPRRKAAGYHAVWDQYRRMIRGTSDHDGFEWHFHTVPVSGHALEYNTCWTNNDYPERVLARRLLERRAFPSVFRAGGIIERNDLSWWLEQFIPFDFSSGAMAENAGRPGRNWDWRHAPLQWKPYHPDWYDYRRTGNMRRRIFRCLEIDGYEYLLQEDDVRAAFEAAAGGEDVVLAYTSHDRRDLEPGVTRAVQLLRSMQARYPGVPWRFASAAEAARAVAGYADMTPPCFSHSWKADVLFLESDQDLFGPIPFLALEQEGEVFFRDNPTIEGPRQWAYVLPRPRRTVRIGVAGCNVAGAVGLTVIDV
ncbi:MAG TPA: hypothetical protein VED01_23835 [Burkholderiales bacterium]|nr:hypothetical protein [Burkholderiales bacterium]